MRSNWKPSNAIWNQTQNGRKAFVQVVNNKFRTRIYTDYGELLFEGNESTLPKAKAMAFKQLGE